MPPRRPTSSYSPTLPSTGFVPSTSPGVHFLASPGIVAELVGSSGVRAGDLVIDFGAGEGAITAQLLDTGARVLAVERDAEFVHRLRRRFGQQPQVRVVHADLRSVPLPRRAYTVVASIPFAVSTPLLRRLLHDVDTSFGSADLVVEWGLACRLSTPTPRSFDTAWWAARFDLRIGRRIPARSFRPAPAVDAAHLVIRRSAAASGRPARALWSLLRAAYAEPARPAQSIVAEAVPRRRAHRLMLATGADPPAPAAVVTATQWRSVAVELAADRDLALPALPRAARSAAGSGTAARPGARARGRRTGRAR